MTSIDFAKAHQTKIPRIDWLALRPTSAASAIAVFRGEIAKFGYIEAGNIVIEFRSADNKLDRLPALAEEMARLKVNVLVTLAVNEAVAVTNITKIISIVFAGVASGEWTIPGRLRGARE